MPVCTSQKNGASFVAGNSATRLWRVSKESGRPFPRLSEDDVIDFMITEAVALRVDREDQKAIKKQERDQWKKDTSGLDALKDTVAQ